MSTDWSKYSTPEETRLRHKMPEANGVIQLQVGESASSRAARRAAPLPDNRAHTDVIGEKDVEARLSLYRIAQWAIVPKTEPTS